jgi:hypothetical protein
MFGLVCAENRFLRVEKELKVTNAPTTNAMWQLGYG